MTFKRAVYASTLAAGVGLAGLFGVGLGTASAQPGPPCNAPRARRRKHRPGGGPGGLAAPRYRPGARRPPAVQLERPAGHPDARRKRPRLGLVVPRYLGSAV